LCKIKLILWYISFHRGVFLSRTLCVVTCRVSTNLTKQISRRFQEGFQEKSRTCLHCFGLLCTGCSKKTDPLDYFDDNFGKYGQILTMFSLLQKENHGTQNWSYFSHLTFIVLPLYLAKQTLMLVSMSLLRHYCLCIICYILMLLIIYIG